MKRILICGYLGFENFGDEAILSVLLRDLLKVGFQRQNITVISNNSSLTRVICNVNSINRKNILEVFASLMDHDALIFIGGLFQDKTSLASFMYYFLILFLGIIFQKEIVFWGIGIGPLQRKISQTLFNFALEKVHYITVRDRTSANATTHAASIPVTCDPVWSIEPNYNFKDKLPNINWELPILGIALRNDKNLKRFHIEDLTERISKILITMKEWQVVLIPCMPSEDLPVLYALHDHLLKKIPVPDKITIIENFLKFTIQEQAGILASCDVMISMRYHALLVPLTNGKSIFGIICDQKIKSLLESTNQVGALLKDNFEQPWNYFWQNLERSSELANKSKETAKELHKKNIELLERLYSA